MIYVPKSYVEERRSDSINWEKVKNFSLALSSIISACAIPVVGHWISQSVKQEELKLKYTELAINILQEAPDDNNQAIREWATKTINHYSEVKLSAEAEESLKISPLPVTGSTVGSPYSQRVPASPRRIEAILISDTFSPSAQVTLNALRQIKHTSYHYLIATDGTVHKLVPEENIAHFAGAATTQNGKRYSEVSIGIGLVHMPEDQKLIKLDDDHPSLGPDYPDEQLAALHTLLVEICLRHSLDPSSILTQQDVSPERKRTDLFGNKLESLRQEVHNSLSR